MRLPGFCTGCHRVKQVQVSNAGMAAVARRGVPSGVCVQCQDTCRFCRKSERDCRADAREGTQQPRHNFVSKG